MPFVPPFRMRPQYLHPLLLALPALQVIFQHYARDLEAVQAAYEANKHKPPLPRNAPPIVSSPIHSALHPLTQPCPCLCAGVFVHMGP
jgi:hypothetical protein